MRPIGALPARPPFPWAALLDYLAHRLIPGTESIGDGRYFRQLDRETAIRISHDPQTERLLVEASGACDKAFVMARAAALFDPGFDPAPARAVLERSRALKARLGMAPGLRPPGAWAPFELCARTVIGQQVSVAAAGTLMHRLAGRCNGSITPASLLQARLDAIGMPGRRVECLRALARAMAEGQLDFSGPWQDAEAVLRELPGVGPWTRAYLGIRLGRQPDAFPESDLGLLRAAGAASPKDLLRMAERWRPWRAHAAIYLWGITPRP